MAVHPRIRLNRVTIWAITACVVGAAGFVLTAITATEEHLAPTVGQEHVVAVTATVLFGLIALVTRRRPSAFLYILGSGGLFGIPWYQLAIMAAAGLVGVLTGIIVLAELQPNLPWWVGLCMVLAAAVATLGVVALSRHHPDVIRRREHAHQTGAPSP